MATAARNDPCPCGSGRKYKRCCLGRERKRTLADFRVPALIGGLGLAAGVTVAIVQDWELGVAVGGAGLVGAIAWAVFRDPPPSRPGGDPAGLGFGM